MDAEEVIDFWFTQIRPAQWWGGGAGLDRIIAERFGATHARAIRGELFNWRIDPPGRLAEILVLDQFSRNIYRGTALAFAADPMALALAQEAVAANVSARLRPQQRAFLYMPYMHSESREIHEIAVRLFSEPGLEDNLDSEFKHKAIIDRFGRYPHRNAMLGRLSSDEEIGFLEGSKPSF